MNIHYFLRRISLVIEDASRTPTPWVGVALADQGCALSLGERGHQGKYMGEPLRHTGHVSRSGAEVWRDVWVGGFAGGVVGCDAGLTPLLIRSEEI